MEGTSLPSSFMSTAPPMVEQNNNELPPPHQNKRCCDCNCDCGHSLMNTFSDMVNEKVGPLYEALQRVENLLVSVVSIKYPELKRKLGSTAPTPVSTEITPHDPSHDDEDETPKKRRRIYSHHISNKISTTLEPYFEENWRISKDKEREIGHKLAEEIGLEKSEGITVVKSFWHRSRGNSKRLFTQLYYYRQGCDFILQLPPDKRQEALNYFKIESEDVLRTDIVEVERILEEMAKKGSGRTAVKGKKTLKPLPDQPIKTVKGRASALSNHFYQMVESQSLDVLPLLEDASGMDTSSVQSPNSATTPTHHSHHHHTHSHHHTQQPHALSHTHTHHGGGVGGGGNGGAGGAHHQQQHHTTTTTGGATGAGSNGGGSASLSPPHSHHSGTPSHLTNLLPSPLGQSPHHPSVPQLSELGLSPTPLLAPPLRLTAE